MTLRALAWLRPATILTALVGALLGAIVAHEYEALVARYTRASPYIAVVASQRSVDFPIPTEFIQGFENARDQKNYIDARNGLQVGIRILEDLGSEDEAARIANELAEDENCILVIGNSNSTLTNVTLDIFLRSANPPTYILPIATANDLLTKANTGGHNAVLRMVPDNGKQAEVIERVARTLSTQQRIAIYGDQENSFYSLGLSRDIASRIRERKGKIVVEEAIGPTNSFLASLPAWATSSQPEVLIYVGVAHHGLLLIDQLSETSITAPIIFTDGAMVKALLTNIGKINNKAFVLSPVGLSERGEMPTYEPIGRDAYALASQIVSSCDDCSRLGVREWVAANKEMIRFSGAAGNYSFDLTGNNTGMTYRVYEVTGGQLREFEF